MSTSNIHPIHEMTLSVYRERRETLRATYGDKKKQAGIRWEQELSKLFADTGWSEDKLVEEEGKKKSWINYRLRFGRFLNWLEQQNSTMVEKPENLHITLSERKFRGFWEQTEKHPKEKFRFKEVLELIGEDAIVKPASGERKAYCQKLLRKYGDGKWHKEETIHAYMGENSEVHLAAIMRQGRKGMFSVVVEKRKYGTTHAYKVFGRGKKVDMAVLQAEIGPILDELKKEGKCNMATMSPAHVATLTQQLRNIIDKLAQ